MFTTNYNFAQWLTEVMHSEYKVYPFNDVFLIFFISFWIYQVSLRGQKTAKEEDDKSLLVIDC